MKEIKYIVTHGGSAHRDDFLSVSVLLASIKQNVNVFRRDPRQGELEDPSIAVIDVGMKHEVEKNNYDHHQSLLPCAFHLIMGSLKLDEKARVVFPWYDITNEIDTKGPFIVSDSLGITKETFFSLNSPLENFILDDFSEQSNVDYTTICLMSKLGKGIVDKIHQTYTRLELLKSFNTSIVVEVNGLKGIFVPLKMKEPTLAFDLYRKDKDISFSITPSDRGKGWTVFRFDDDPRLHFNCIEGMNDIEFAHKGGFIFTTKEKINIDRVLDYIRICIY